MATGGRPSHTATADFDGNGVLDFATANLLGSVTVVLGDGLGGFDVLPEIVALARPVGIAAGDFNADGTADLVVTHLSDELLVLIGDGKGGFTASSSMATGEEPVFVASADFDFDGDSDVVVANALDDSVTVLSSNGDGSLTMTAEIPVGDFPRAHRGGRSEQRWSLRPGRDEPVERYGDHSDG